MSTASESTRDSVQRAESAAHRYYDAHAILSEALIFRTQDEGARVAAGAAAGRRVSEYALGTLDPIAAMTAAVRTGEAKYAAPSASIAGHRAANCPNA